MRNDSTSAQKIESLRQVTNFKVPNSYLRKVLIRCAGDLNRAATELLLNPPPSATPNPSTAHPTTNSAPSPPKPQPQPSQTPHKPKAQPNPGAKLSLAQQNESLPRPCQTQPQSSAQSPIVQQTPRKSPAAIATSKEHTSPDINRQQTPTSTPIDQKEARKLAWRKFYLERRTEAIRAVGTDKRNVDSYIAGLWKDMGSAGRKQYVADFVQARVREQSNNDLSPSQSQPNQSQPNFQSQQQIHKPQTQPDADGTACPSSAIQTSQKHLENANSSNGSAISTHNVDQKDHCESSVPEFQAPQRTPENFAQDIGYADDDDTTIPPPGVQPAKSEIVAWPDGRKHAKSSDGHTLTSALSAITHQILPANSIQNLHLKHKVTVTNPQDDDSRNDQPHSDKDINAEVDSAETNPQTCGGDVEATKPDPKEDLINVNWPRKLMSRLCRGSMLTVGRNKISPGDQLALEAPPLQTPTSMNRGRRKRGVGGSKNNFSSNNNTNSQATLKSTRTRIVRFSKNGRELGRLAPEIAQALGPALQSGYIFTTCKVVSAPVMVKMFSEVILEVVMYVEESAFSRGCGVDEMKFEGGYNDTESNESDADTGDDENIEGKKNGKEKRKEKDSSKESGVDMRRLNVVHLISSLGICELPQTADINSPTQNRDENLKMTVSEDGAVSEEGAEAYYRTVDAIEERDAAAYTPSPFLACTLREYQRVGVHWMIKREIFGNSTRQGGRLEDSSVLVTNPLWKKRQFPDGGAFFMNTSTGGLSLKTPGGVAGGPYGGILADEMGLGKTVQCIATIVHDVQQIRGLKMEETIPNVAEGEEEELDKEESTKSTEGRVNPDDDTTRSPSIHDEHEDDEEAKTDSDFIQKKNISHKDEDRDMMNDDESPIRDGQDNLDEDNEESEEKEDSEDESGGEKCSDDSNDDDKSDNENSEDSRKSGEEADRQVDEDYIPDDGDDVNGDDDDDSDLEIHRPLKRLRPVPSNLKPRKKMGRQGPAPQRTKSKLKINATDVLMQEVNQRNNKKGGTLIVCPTSLITQWMNELIAHVKPGFLRCVSHYGTGRGDGRSISLLVADVVVTTYGTLASEWIESDSSGGKRQSGGLFELTWRRVILDEAHTIKSRMTKWAKAAYRLKAERRWCVTGTVIHNHVNDVFSLLHFLRLRPWASWAFWNQGIVSNLEGSNQQNQRIAMCLMRDLISSITLRRKKSTKDSAGNPIVQLTRKTVDMVMLTASSEERDFYTALHKRTKTKFDTFLAHGNIGKNFASVLELLLRLRQACDHPFLVFSAAPSKDAHLLRDKDRLYRAFLTGGQSGNSLKDAADSGAQERHQQFVEGVLKDAETGKLKSQMCPVCLDVIEDAVAPKECGHPACRACLTASLQHSKKCPVCRVTIAGPESILTLPRAVERGTELTRFAVDMDKAWRPSAKIIELLRELKERDEERQKTKQRIGKSVVFSQFTAMLDLVQFALQREGMSTLRVDGSVSQAKRASVLRQFAEDDELDRGKTANVLLVSLRAGGVGLNLVAASHAVLLDIHWNPQVDAQATDRIHRHGQCRDVVVKRYVMKDTVEERLVDMQQRKQMIADGALDEASDEDKKQARITELKLLFGSGA